MGEESASDTLNRAVLSILAARGPLSHDELAAQLQFGDADELIALLTIPRGWLRGAQRKGLAGGGRDDAPAGGIGDRSSDHRRSRCDAGDAVRVVCDPSGCARGKVWVDWSP